MYCQVVGIQVYKTNLDETLDYHDDSALIKAELSVLRRK